MQKIEPRDVQNIILAVESLLVLITICLGWNSRTGVGCYWAMIVIYHLTEYLWGILGRTGKGGE